MPTASFKYNIALCIAREIISQCHYVQWGRLHHRSRYSESTDLSHADTPVWNKWRKKIKTALVEFNVPLDIY